MCIMIYPPPPECNPSNVITGYTASNSVTVTLDADENVGSVIDSAVADWSDKRERRELLCLHREAGRDPQTASLSKPSTTQGTAQTTQQLQSRWRSRE